VRALLCSLLPAEHPAVQDTRDALCCVHPLCICVHLRQPVTARLTQRSVRLGELCLTAL
jgi:hypothetical protein